MVCWVMLVTFALVGVLALWSFHSHVVLNMKNTLETISKLFSVITIRILTIFFYFSCWLQYDSNLLLAQLVPITVMVVASIMMVEAAGSVDESNMTRLDGKVAQFRFAIFMPYWFILGSDEAQRMSAKVMHGSLFPRLMICFISFIIGSMATYQQEIFEYFVFTVLNGILGFVIFFFHCTSNETVSFWFFLN